MPLSTGGVFLPTYDTVITGAWTIQAPIVTTPTITGGTSTTKGVVTTIPGDGAIAIAAGAVLLTKGSAAAITLVAPAAADLGTQLRIYAGSAFAHVVTATGLVDDGVTGGSKTTLTFGAFVGSSITLEAVQVGKWAVTGKNVVTIT